MAMRMIRNWKIHALAIAAITIVIYLLYSATRPEPVGTAPSAPASGRSIQIVSASWGLECNRYLNSAIERANEQRAKLPSEERNSVPMPKEITVNNALERVQSLCDGKETCTFRADDDTIGIETYRGCGGDLDVSYRCFKIDRLHKLSVNRNENVTLDCRAKKP
jgi:hypothetical protein